MSDFFLVQVFAMVALCRECPLSLEASHGLLSLGVKGAEVASFMMSTSANLAALDW